MVEKSSDLEIIGFDLGHGESAVALAREGALTPPQILDIQGTGSIITAVAKDPTRGILIGEDAYLARSLDSLRVTFKGPQVHDPSVREPTKWFVGKVIETLVEEGRIRGDKDSLYVVGCPSGWPAAVRAEYTDLLRQAGMENVSVIAESRAAFLYCRETGEISEDMLDGSVLIIDIGSSTTDFTAIVNNTECPFDFGHNQLGGALLDKAIKRRVIDQHSHQAMLDDILSNHPHYRARCEIACRRAKERYFSNEGSFVEESAEYSVRIPSEPPIRFDVELRQTDMQAILRMPLPEVGDMTWQDAFRSVLVDAKVVMGSNQPQLVLLTGGASRMGFTLSLSQQVFPGARVVRGAEPEFAIARGLAWAGRIDRKVAAFRKETERIFAQGTIRLIVDKQIPALVELVSAAVCHDIVEHVFPSAIKEWKDGRIRTLNDLQPVLENKGIRYLETPSAKERLTVTIVQWMNSFRTQVDALTNPICDKYQIPRATIGLPSSLELKGGLRANGIDVGKAIGLDDLTLIVNLVVSTVVASILGGAGWALLMEGMAGLAIGFVLSMVLLAMGRGRAKDWIMVSNLPLMVRQIVSGDRFMNRLRKESPKLQRGIMEQFATPKGQAELETLIQEICRSLRAQLLRQAEKAESMIHRTG